MGARLGRFHRAHQRSRFLRAARAVVVLRQKPHRAISAIRSREPCGVRLGVRRILFRPRRERRETIRSLWCRRHEGPRASSALARSVAGVAGREREAGFAATSAAQRRSAGARPLRFPGGAHLADAAALLPFCSAPFRPCSHASAFVSLTCSAIAAAASPGSAYFAARVLLAAQLRGPVPVSRLMPANRSKQGVAPLGQHAGHGANGLAAGIAALRHGVLCAHAALPRDAAAARAAHSVPTAGSSLEVDRHRFQ